MSNNTTGPNDRALRARLPTSQAVSGHSQDLALTNAGPSATPASPPSAPEFDKVIDVATRAEPAQLAERRIAAVGSRWTERADARNRAQPQAAREDRTPVTPIPLALPQAVVSSPVGSNTVQDDVLFSAAQSAEQPDSPVSDSDYDRLLQLTESSPDPLAQPIYSPEELSQVTWESLYPGVLPPSDQEAQFVTDSDPQFEVSPADSTPFSGSDQQYQVPPEDNMSISEGDQQFQPPYEDNTSLSSSDHNMTVSDIEEIYGQQINELKKQVSALEEANNDLHEKLVERDDRIEGHAVTFDKLNQEVKASRTAAMNAQYGTTDLQKQLKEKAEQFDKEKSQHAETKQEKGLVEIQNEKLKKQLYKANDMLKEQIDQREKIQITHDNLVAEVSEKEGELQDQAQEIENYMAQRQRDQVAIERLNAIHNILATYLPLQDTLDITTVTPAEISDMVQQLADADRPGSPADSPTELRINRLAGRPSTTRHVSLSDQLGDERLSESEGEEEEEELMEEPSAVVADDTKPAGLGLTDEKLPELKEAVEKDTLEKPTVIVADSAPAGPEEITIQAPSKAIDAAPILPPSSKPEPESSLAHYIDKKQSIDLLWYAWFFLGLVTLLFLFVNWQERQLWYGANEFTRDAVVQHRGLQSVIFGKGNGAFWARQLRFEIERLIGVDTGVLG